MFTLIKGNVKKISKGKVSKLTTKSFIHNIFIKIMPWKLFVKIQQKGLHGCYAYGIGEPPANWQLYDLNITNYKYRQIGD